MGPAVMAVAMVVSAAGAVASGVAASHQATYQANVAKQNAEFERQKGEAIAKDSATKAAQLGLKQKATVAGMEASEASGGLEVGSGSNKALISGTKDIARADSQAYGLAAAQDWFSARKGQYAAQAESVLQESKSRMAMMGGMVKGGSSLLSGMSQGNQEYGWFS